jgi:solute:Na+ symporter, SSS family
MNDLQRATFAPIDWGVLALYLAFLLLVGFWPRRRDTESYLIADRNLSLPVFVATLVATWYGGILGAGEFAYNYGLLAWTTNGLPYYVFAICFALFLARRVRGGAAHLYTIPDKLAEAYDRKTALLGALFAFIYASPSTYVLMAGTLLHLLFGWPLLWAMLVGILFSVVYVFRGGFLSDVRVNTLQFLLMFTGFVAAAWLCLTHWGGLHELTASGHLPPTHLRLLGDQTPAYVAIWFFIALTTLTDPGFHQRCYAARTPLIAVAGILTAVVCWFCFDLLTTTTGLFARAMIPNLTDAKMAFPALAERIMPPGVPGIPGIKGLFYVGMLAPVMASIVSYTFISAMTVGRDFIWRLRAEPDNGNVPRYTRIGLFATSALSILVAFAVPSVVQQWYAFGNVFVPGMLLPLLGAYARSPRWKAPASFAFWSMVAGATVALGWLLWGWRHGGYDDPNFPLGWQPMYPGLLACALIYGAGLLRKQFHNSPAAHLNT